MISVLSTWTITVKSCSQVNGNNPKMVFFVVYFIFVDLIASNENNLKFIYLHHFVEHILLHLLVNFEATL